MKQGRLIRYLDCFRVGKSANFPMKHVWHPLAKLFVFGITVIIPTIYLLLWIVGQPCFIHPNKESVNPRTFVTAYGPRLLSSAKIVEHDNDIDGSIYYENWNKHYGKMFEEWFSAAENKFVWNFPKTNVSISNEWNLTLCKWVCYFIILVLFCGFFY